MKALRDAGAIPGVSTIRVFQSLLIRRISLWARASRGTQRSPSTKREAGSGSRWFAIFQYERAVDEHVVDSLGQRPSGCVG